MGAKHVDFKEAIERFIYNAMDFSGRATRSEFWYVFLALLVVNLVLTRVSFLGIIFSLIIFIPNTSLCCRRLHDIGKSAWYLLLLLIPIVGWIAIIVILAMDSDPNSNEWGNPAPAKLN